MSKKPQGPDVPPIGQIRYATRTGPWLVTAVICEYFIEDKNDNVPSLIRIVDRFTVTKPPSGLQDAQGNALQTVGVIGANLVMHFVSDKARGKLTLTLGIERPDGIRIPIPANVPMLFEGEDRGVRIASKIDIEVPIEGLYWIEIFVDGDLVGRTPVRVIFTS